LKKNFEEVTVKVVDCPDLTQKPFDLAAKGWFDDCAFGDNFDDIFDDIVNDTFVDNLMISLFHMKT
jgi:hypothetical protein